MLSALVFAARFLAQNWADRIFGEPRARRRRRQNDDDCRLPISAFMNVARNAIRSAESRKMSSSRPVFERASRVANMQVAREQEDNRWKFARARASATSGSRCATRGKREKKTRQHSPPLNERARGIVKMHASEQNWILAICRAIERSSVDSRANYDEFANDDEERLIARAADATSGEAVRLATDAGDPKRPPPDERPNA